MQLLMRRASLWPRLPELYWGLQQCSSGLPWPSDLSYLVSLNTYHLSVYSIGFGGWRGCSSLFQKKKLSVL